MGGLNNYQYAPNPVSWIDPFGLTCKEGENSKSKQRNNLKGDTKYYQNKKTAIHEAKIRAGITDRDTPSDRWIVGDDQTRIGQPGYVYNDNVTHHGEFWQYETNQGSRVIAVHTGDPKGAHVHAGMPKGGESYADFRDPDVRYQQVGGAHHYFYGDLPE